MAEKRQHRRHRRRLVVKYGEKALNLNGFTFDVSQGGMFLVAGQLLPLGSRFHLQLFLDPNQFVFFEGEVRRHKIVPPQLRTVERGGFGVRFLHPGEVVKQVLQLQGEPGRLRFEFESPEQLKEIYERELRHRGLFLPTPDAYTRDTKVTVELDFPFAEQNLELQATVVHVATAEPKGVGVVFTDPGADTLIRQLLPK